MRKRERLAIRWNAVPISLLVSSSSLKQQLIDYLSSIIPQVIHLKNTPFQRLQNELFAHHNLIVLFSSDNISNLNKTIAWTRLFTIQSLLMFLMALLYDLQSPSDDSTCSGNNNISSCLARKLLFDNSHSYCKWDYDNSQCLYQYLPISVQFILASLITVFIIIEILSFPIDLLFDVIRSPLKQKEENITIKEKDLVPSDKIKLFFRAYRKKC